MDLIDQGGLMKCPWEMDRLGQGGLMEHLWSGWSIGLADQGDFGGRMDSQVNVDSLIRVD